MTIGTPPARIHILPALRSPVAVVLRRKPSKWCHVMRWNTATDEIEHGSWFQGRIYEDRCDVSPDGLWMVYLAMGRRGETWNALCRLPRLTAVGWWSNIGTWFGGGYFEADGTLVVDADQPSGARCETPSIFVPGSEALPFAYKASPPSGPGPGPRMLWARLARDGWRRAGTIPAETRDHAAHTYTTVCASDPGWYLAPEAGATLRMFYRGFRDGRSYEFALDEYPSLLNPGVYWACWDAKGHLLVARGGCLERYRREDLASGQPVFTMDLESLTPPARTDVENPAPLEP